jgi:UDP-2,3-diacylglucosamine pyrophosphatase LpxH
MTFAFDLISDLHIETWNSFDWDGQPTSPYCVVAGDVARDRGILLKTLEHLSDHYAGVFYIDGNDEHRSFMDDIGESYRSLNQDLKKIKNLIYLQDNVIIINGVAILATNGWWSYDFDPNIDYNETVDWYQDYLKISNSVANSITGIAYNDSKYLANSVKKLQTHSEVKSIVLVSHTVPNPQITKHDIELVGNVRYNCLGNPHLQLSLDQDTENKIKLWCFGHYHKSVDQKFDNIRYVSNPRGRGDTPWCQPAYYPKRIEVEI